MRNILTFHSVFHAPPIAFTLVFALLFACGHESHAADFLPEVSAPLHQAVRDACSTPSAQNCAPANAFLELQSQICHAETALFQCPKPEDLKPEDRAQLRRCDDKTALCEESVLLGWDAVRGCLTGALVPLSNFGSLIAKTSEAAIHLVQKAATEATNRREWLEACNKSQSARCKRDLIKDISPEWNAKSDEELKKTDAFVLEETKLAIEKSRAIATAMREMDSSAQNLEGSRVDPSLQRNSSLLWTAAAQKLREAGIELGCYGAYRRAQLACYGVFSIVYPKMAFQFMTKAYQATRNFGSVVVANEVTLLSGGEAAASAVNPNGFSVTVWNVAKFKNPRSIPDAMSLAEKSDLVLLQEGYWNPAFRNLVSQADGKWWGGVVSFKDAQGIATGVVSGGRVAPTNATGFLTTAREPLLKTPKTMMATYYPVQGKAEELMVLNVHSINFVPQKSFESQLAQIAKALETHNGPVVLAGDFNTWSPARLKALGELASKNGLQHVNPIEADKRLLPLDHVFVRDLQVKRARVDGAIGSSDHQPLRLDLQLP